jgi:hypothetical protein
MRFSALGRGERADKVHVQVRKTATGYLDRLDLGGDVDCGFSSSTVLAVFTPGRDV